MNDGVSGERARLFVALELPGHVRMALAGWAGPLRLGDEALRLVDSEALHVTLCFLGSLAVGEIGAIGDACAAAVGEAGAVSASLSLGEAVWLPRRRPHVLAVRIEDAGGGALGRVHAALSDALERGGWYAPEARPFLPHVTVARVPARARQRPIELPAPPALTFAGSAVTLFRSRTLPRGARYEPLRSLRLQLNTA